MKNMLAFLGICMLSAGAFAQASVATDRSELIYEIYLNGIFADSLPQPADPTASPPRAAVPGNPVPLREHHRALLNAIPRPVDGKGGGLKLLWETASPEVGVPKTRHRVRGATPGCEGGKTVESELFGLGILLTTVAGSADKAVLGGIPVFSGITAYLMSLVINRDTYQTGSNCAMACAVVPALVRQEQMHFRTLWAAEGGALAPRAVGGWDQWSRLDDIVIGKDVIKLPAGSAGLQDVTACEARLVCTRVRNWSAHRGVKAKLEVSFDADPATAFQMCTDPSMVSLSYRTLQMKAMNTKLAAKYFEEWTSDQYKLLGSP